MNENMWERDFRLVSWLKTLPEIWNLKYLVSFPPVHFQTKAKRTPVQDGLVHISIFSLAVRLGAYDLPYSIYNWFSTLNPRVLKMWVGTYLRSWIVTQSGYKDKKKFTIGELNAMQYRID